MANCKAITNIPELRRGNTSAVLSLIWEYREITRRELSEKTSLTLNTVSSIVNDLLKKKIVFISGKEGSSGGRQPDIIKFNPHVRHIIGISLGVYRTKAVITDLFGNKLKEFTIELTDAAERPDILNRISKIMDILLSSIENREKIYGVGVSFPGTVNHTTGVVMDSSIIGTGRDVNIKRYITEKYGFQTFVENNVNLCALNESVLGKGKTRQIVLFVYAGYGIGSGLTINGDIYEGARDSAGNMGHIVIEPNGRKCYCGSFGCLETVASFPALFENYQRNVKMGAKADFSSIIDREFSVEAVKEIFDYAQHGDDLALNSVKDIGLYIGIATANLIGILNPDIVIFGGEYYEIGSLILPTIQNAVRTRAWVTIKDTELVFSDYGFDADVYGAVALVINNFKEFSF